MGEYTKLIEEYEAYSIRQYDELNDLDLKIRAIIYELEASLSFAQEKKFAELIFRLKTYRYLFCEDVIRFMMQKNK